MLMTVLGFVSGLWQNHNTNWPNKNFENVVKYRHLGTILINQNCLNESQEQIILYHQSQILSSSLVLYDTWSLTLREEHRLRVFENRVLRKMFGPKSDEVTGQWRRLHNEELLDLYFLPEVIRLIKWSRMRWAEDIAHVGQKTTVCGILVQKPEGNRPLWRMRNRWEDNIKIGLKEMVEQGMDWMYLSHDMDNWWAAVNLVINTFDEMRGLFWWADCLLVYYAQSN